VLIREIMVTTDLLVATESDRLAVAAQKMLWGRVRHLPVLRKQEVVGVVSERDVLARRGQPEPPSWEDELVGAVMSHPPLVAVPDQPIAQAAATLAANRIGCLPVVVDGRLVGMVTTTDLLGAAVRDKFRAPPMLERPVREAMREEVFSVREDDSVMEAVDLMVSRRVRHVPVVDNGGRVVGILSDRDIRTFLGDPAEAVESWPVGASRIRVGAVMTRDPVVTWTDSPLSASVAEFLIRGIGALPVVDQKGCLRGMLSYLDVIRALRR
jgi:CBS domain-containing protein